MYDQSFAPRAPREGAVTWTFGDIVLVLAASVLLVVALAVAVGLILALAAPDVEAILRDNTVVVSAVTGTLVYGILLLAVYLLIVRRRDVAWSTLGFRPPPLLGVVVAPVVVLGQLSAAAAVNLLILRLTGEFENPQAEAITGGEAFAWRNFLLMLLLVGVVAPIVEEVLFRGVIYGWLRARLPVFAAVVINAAVFSLAHVIPVLLPALFVVGIFLALAYELSNSLWVSILLHAIQNSLAVTIVFTSLALGLPAGG